MRKVWGGGGLIDYNFVDIKKKEGVFVVVIASITKWIKKYRNTFE